MGGKCICCCKPERLNSFQGSNLISLHDMKEGGRSFTKLSKVMPMLRDAFLKKL